MFSSRSSHTSNLSTYFRYQLHLRKGSPSSSWSLLGPDCCPERLQRRPQYRPSPFPLYHISSASDRALNHCSFIETFGLNNSSLRLAKCGATKLCDSDFPTHLTNESRDYDYLTFFPEGKEREQTLWARCMQLTGSPQNQLS